jgi:hypothetical protein
MFPELYIAISYFIKTSNFIGRYGYKYIFKALVYISISQKYNIYYIILQLFILIEFIYIIKLGKYITNNNFLISLFPITTIY